MTMSVDIYTHEDHVGTILLSADNKFTVYPSGSRLMQNIMKEPVFARVNGAMEDVYAKDDPQLFMRCLFTHYKSQGLRATEAKDTHGGDS